MKSSITLAVSTLVFFFSCDLNREQSAPSDLPEVVSAHGYVVPKESVTELTKEQNPQSFSSFGRQGLKNDVIPCLHLQCFISNGTHTKIVYDIEGYRKYAIISYTEAKLDRNIRTLVKRTICTYKIK